MTMTADIKKAAAILRKGGLVAFPTETVYGLGADATNPEAIAKIFMVKERPIQHPLIVHLGSTSELPQWSLEITPTMLCLAEAFWPGPLTLIVRKQPQVLASLTGGQDTVGLRIPKHPIAQGLLHAFGGGIAAPSANKFTHLSPTTAEDVREDLGEQVDFILDGGRTEVGVESTIVDMSRDQPMILRPGMITRPMLEKVLCQPILSANEIAPAHVASTKPSSGSRPHVPGQHPVHYAPRTPTFVIEADELPRRLACLEFANRPVALLVRNTAVYSMWSNVVGIHWVEMPNEPEGYAHELYFMLHQLDHGQFKQIIIESLPDDAVWEALKDRIGKASGKR